MNKTGKERKHKKQNTGANVAQPPQIESHPQLSAFYQPLAPTPPMLIARPHGPSPLAAGCSTTVVASSANVVLPSASNAATFPSSSSSSTSQHRSSRALSIGAGSSSGLLKKTITKPKKSTDAALCPVLTDDGKKLFEIETSKMAAKNTGPSKN
uniref:Uncharacterized protein n=1 Tax=Romanomermis culicivorax TaxID=13658 RepID=A0A915IMB6_ROMCU